jgi:hypothetical protein
MRSGEQLLAIIDKDAANHKGVYPVLRCCKSMGVHETRPFKSGNSMAL